MVFSDMAAAKLLPKLSVQPDYGTWFGDVRSVLATMHIEMEAWQENWEFDFRSEYNRGSTARDAAVHAQDYWWQQLMAESWT